jgi:hypothetical protein
LGFLLTVREWLKAVRVLLEALRVLVKSRRLRGLVQAVRELL